MELNLEEIIKLTKENKTEEVAKMLQDVIKAETTKFNEGLLKKNEELLNEAKLAKKEKKDYIEKIEGEKKLKEFEKQKSEGNIEEVSKKYQEEISTLQSSIKEYNDKYTNLVIDNDLSKAILKNNIAKQYIPAVKALLKTGNKISVVDSDGKFVPVINDKPLEDFVSQWSKSEEGKIYVAAQQNTGGGASGSKTDSGASVSDGGKIDPIKLMSQSRPS